MASSTRAICAKAAARPARSTRSAAASASASRIGFRGTEDLGNGLSAVFTLETGTKIDTGEVDAAGTIFNRQAFVGLKSRAGMMALGRQYTPVAPGAGAGRRPVHDRLRRRLEERVP
jgi:predicted porin